MTTDELNAAEIARLIEQQRKTGEPFYAREEPLDPRRGEEPICDSE